MSEVYNSTESNNLGMVLKDVEGGGCPDGGLFDKWNHIIGSITEISMLANSKRRLERAIEKRLAGNLTEINDLQEEVVLLLKRELLSREYPGQIWENLKAEDVKFPTKEGFLDLSKSSEVSYVYHKMINATVSREIVDKWTCVKETARFYLKTEGQTPFDNIMFVPVEDTFMACEKVIGKYDPVVNPKIGSGVLLSEFTEKTASLLDIVKSAIIAGLMRKNMILDSGSYLKQGLVYIKPSFSLEEDKVNEVCHILNTGYGKWALTKAIGFSYNTILAALDLGKVTAHVRDLVRYIKIGLTDEEIVCLIVDMHGVKDFSLDIDIPEINNYLLEVINLGLNFKYFNPEFMEKKFYTEEDYTSLVELVGQGKEKKVEEVISNKVFSPTSIEWIILGMILNKDPYLLIRSHCIANGIPESAEDEDLYSTFAKMKFVISSYIAV